MATTPDCKIPNDTFHTCKTQMNLRMTPARLSMIQGETPFRESNGSAKKRFNSKRKVNKSHNETFTRLQGESQNFTPDSLDALRSSSTAFDVSTFVSEERAAIEESQKKSKQALLAPVDEINKFSPILKPDQEQIKQSTPIRDIHEEGKTSEPVQLAEPAKPDAKNLPSKQKPEKFASRPKDMIKPKDILKPKDMLKTKPAVPRSGAVNLSNRHNSRVERKFLMPQTRKNPHNSVMSVGIPRRSLSAPSFRRGGESYKSTAELEREFESSLRLRAIGNTSVHDSSRFSTIMRKRL